LELTRGPWAAAVFGTSTKSREDEAMSQPAKVQEPSMEEILASIRRIIADDDANKSGPQAATEAPPARPAAPPRPVAASDPEPPPEPAAPAAEAFINPTPEPEPKPADEQSSEILDLTDAMAVSAPSPLAATPAPQFRRIEGRSDVDFEEESEQPVAPPPELGRKQIPRGDDDRDHLLSRQTSAAIDSAFNTLAQTVLVQNARTVEDLVREMLRPMLKTWLDDNLPAMVERLVRAEIERVSRGR
jgi:cell pole-organizing protein PopZ